MKMYSARLALLLWLFAGVEAYQLFQNRIPHGEFVPHPCLPNTIWRGAGHLSPLGGGPRNPFGLDFHANGRVWDKTLCEMDSDKDGKTNGEELGDPNCVWSEGEVPELTNFQLSHPGICEPMDSPECQALNWDIDCSTLDFECDAIEEEGVMDVTLLYEEAPVPLADTTYVCQIFELPSDGDYHIIASEPVIDNVNVLHHILVYGIPDPLVPQLQPHFTNASACGMAMFTHNDIISTWSVGLNGQCFPPTQGVRMGTQGFKYIIMEKHWTNPLLLEGLTDASGFKLYYTSNLRTYDQSGLIVAPVMLELAPGRPDVTQQGSCSGLCTKSLFSLPIQITEIYPHMHYLGRKFKVEIVRNGEVVNIPMNISEFTYDSAEIQSYDPPVQVLPGDEIVVTCVWDTTTRDRVVFFGDSSFLAEMCVAFLTYYPKQTIVSICGGNNGISWCGGQIDNYLDEGRHQDCLSKLVALVFGPDTERMKWYNYVNGKCDPSGRECWPGCKKGIAKVLKEPCFDPEIDHAIKTNIIRRHILPLDFLFMMSSCTYDRFKALFDLDKYSPGASGCRSPNQDTVSGITIWQHS